MNTSDLRDKLLDLESYPDDLKDSIREVTQMEERPLKPWERRVQVLCCVILGLLLVGAGVWLVTGNPCPISKAPTYIMLAAGIAAALVCGFLVMMMLSLKRGTWRIRNEQLVVYAAAAFMFYMYLGSMTTNRPPHGWDIGAYILVATLFVVIRIQSSELRLREHMLRNELAIAKLADLIAAKPGGEPKQGL